MVTSLHQLLFSFGQEPTEVDGKEEMGKNKVMKRKWKNGKKKKKRDENGREEEDEGRELKRSSTNTLSIRKG